MLEEVSEKFHSLTVILVNDFTFETVHLVHVFGFVVTSGEMHNIGVVNLPSNESEDTFNGERTSVDEITIEEIRILSTGITVL